MKQFFKAFLRTILIIANIILFCILGVWYFFAFDIQWGLTWQAFTWGLPLLAAIIIVIVCICKFIKRWKWRWGFSGIGVAVFALIYTIFILAFYSYHIVGEPENGPRESLNTDENRILSLVLAHFLDDGFSYDVIYPESSTRYLSKVFSFKERENTKEWIQYNLRFFNEQSYTDTYGSEDDNYSKLIDRFLEINQNPSLLTLKSFPEDGYYIDYDGKFSRYFDYGSEQGWLRMRFCRPGVVMTEISLPAYDPETGLLLIYIGTTSGPFTGRGYMYLMKMENGELETINQVMLFMS